VQIIDTLLITNFQNWWSIWTISIFQLRVNSYW